MNSLKIIGLVLSFTAAALTAAVQEDSLRYTLVEESSLDNGSEVGSNSFFDLRYPPPFLQTGIMLPQSIAKSRKLSRVPDVLMAMEIVMPVLKLHF